MKVVMYGTKACPDCVEAEEILKEKGIQYLYMEFSDNIGYLKRFLTLRDTNPIFDEVKENPLGRRSLLPVPGRKPVTGHRRSRKTGRGRSLNQVELLITSFSALISSILDTKKACLATARFYKMYQCQYRCEVDSNTCIYAGEFSCSQNSGNMILPV